MNEKNFVAFCRKTVAELKNAELEKIGVKITEVSGSEYYEVTYDGDKKIAYVDEYIKVAQRVVVM